VQRPQGITPKGSSPPAMAPRAKRSLQEGVPARGACRPCPRPLEADALPPERYNLSPRLRRGACAGAWATTISRNPKTCQRHDRTSGSGGICFAEIADVGA
jgi:hypothetical protein